MKIQSANFSFLREHDPQLVNLAARAEQFFLDDDSNTCIIKLGQFAERLAKLIAANKGLSQVPREAQLELIQRLRREGIISSEVDDLFHSIRKARNDIIHDIRDADSHEALTLLKDARYLGIWFHRAFSDKDFRAKPFVRPAAPIDAPTELIAKIAELQALIDETEAGKTGVIAELKAEIDRLQALVAKEGKKRKKKLIKTKRKPVEDTPEQPPTASPNIPSPKQEEGRKRDGWHHGVIGIVASRLVERYGAPVFIGSYEDAHDDSEQADTIRFSVRGIPEFHVFQAIEYEPVKSIRLKGGGHKAAGGFTLPAANLEKLRQGLREFADRENILPSHIMPLVNIDARVDLSDISMTLLQQCDRLQPCGLGNPDPVFYSTDVRVISQQTRGKDKVKHLALTLDNGNGEKLKAIAWRWGEYCPVPDRVDIAYKLRANQWQDTTSVELEIIGIREANSGDVPSARKLQLFYKPAPRITQTPQWQYLHEAPRPLPRPLLLYGYDRPADKFKGDDVDYDRPSRQRNYQSLVLWTLPPSFGHLQWLVAIAKPEYIYLGNHIPPIPTAAELRTQIQSLDLDNLPALNLLDLAQQWWVSPSAIVAALRELDYICDFPNTATLDDELQKMQRWYDLAIGKLEKHLASL